ncbi:RNA polymerase II transcription factor B subunit 4 [Scheffersomyces spartinae]|uniref:General transcription and DNA repair factor IIH subunit TFB4 n=1 Tax=Scheffersomyces spartinae TaxID=45513 RepID=A0A9P8AJ75_9ASCO|nr:RNA polymerase II transcription factor B subunit 4 [Scheffersomyces spartinae]KAG7193877.1 RNA polymerase II transcription factor B subunit 4 [Scheffersomyces spartinae]
MDAISDNVFNDLDTVETVSDDPSLLTVILDISPGSWFQLRDQISIVEVTKSLLVFLNAHLSLNNSNQVAFIVSSPVGSKFLYPSPVHGTEEQRNKPTLITMNMYRQFRVVDEAVLQDLNTELEQIRNNKKSYSAVSTLAGALSMALTYTHRMLTLDQSIRTTTQSAINNTTNSQHHHNSGGTGNSNGSGHSSQLSSTNVKSRILVVSADDTDDLKYIPIMNSIFAAQKIKTSIDVAKLGAKNSSYLQQASDATNGVYLKIEDPKGLIQVLSSAFFIEPSVRPLFILPTNSNVNYRASCFVTGKSVDLGYVCSICLCIMSLIPTDGKCPTCDSNFDARIIAQLKRAPAVVPKKRRKVVSTAPPITP